MGDSPLDPTADEIRAIGGLAVEWMARYHDGIRAAAVYPRTSARALDALLREPLPQAGRGFEELFAVFRDVIVPNSRQNAHPRALGYVTSPGTAVGAVADLLASALGANLTAWRSAPAPVQLERVVVDWLKEALGCDPAASGLLMSGGSMANLAALCAARHRRCGDTASEDGMQAAGTLRVYVSQDAHHSIDKAAAVLGIGRRNVRRVALDTRLRMDVSDLERQVAADRAAGHTPFCVVASAGTVVTGAVDPLRDILAVARRHDLWTHVDGAYGGVAAMAPSVRHLFDGLAEADSLSLDPHKWLYLPVDCGCLIYRDAESVRPAWNLGADYTRVMLEDPDEQFAFWDYGPELSRRFRALKLWMVLAHVGARGMTAAIESNLDAARHCEALVRQSGDFEMLAPLELSIVCFRYLPEAQRGRTERSAGDEREIDACNEQLLGRMQLGGSSYISNASIRGRFALRACVTNYRTTRNDMAMVLDDARAAAAAG